MPTLDAALIAETASRLYVRALKVLPPDVKEALARAHGVPAAEVRRAVEEVAWTPA